MAALPDKSFAILRATRIGSWQHVQKVDAELSRSLRTPTPNWDPARSALNRETVRITDVEGRPLTLEQRIRQLIGPQKIRRNAVLGIELLFAYSPEADAHLDKTKWSRANGAWLAQRFPGMLVKKVTHGDETTTHEQAVIVPFHGETKAGEPKLNARGLMGGRRKMRELQDSYAVIMAPLGLVRGISNSDAKFVPLKQLRRADHQQAELAQKALDLLTQEFPLPDLGPQFEDETDAVYRARQRRQIAMALADHQALVKEAAESLLRFAHSTLRHAGTLRRLKAVQRHLKIRDEETAALKQELLEAHAEIVRLTGVQVDSLRNHAPRLKASAGMEMT
ncbi:MAG: hypothetical protein QOE26_884 [Verrucomicrobiota bacterium]|jgi:hypothetical protein